MRLFECVSHCFAAFYMRLNDDGKTVAAYDLLVSVSLRVCFGPFCQESIRIQVPGVGELVGGSQREERVDFLTKRYQSPHDPRPPPRIVTPASRLLVD